MKTPDEIKKGLKNGESNCQDVDCCETDCPYDSYCKPGSDRMVEIPFALVRDALAYIRQLERERDAAVKDIGRCCATCKHYNSKCCECTTIGCFCISGVNSKWEWRGIQEVKSNA